MPRIFNSSPQRSKTMAAIHSKDTKPEVLLRKALWKMEVRGYRKYPKIPGKPDLLFPRQKLIVFMDGCFWHGCPHHLRIPKGNPDYWPSKIKRNMERDQEINQALEHMGFRVLRIWEHEVTTDIGGVIQLIKNTLDQLNY